MLPHTDRGLLDKRARDQIQTLVICLKKPPYPRLEGVWKKVYVVLGTMHQLWEENLRGLPTRDVSSTPVGMGPRCGERNTMFIQIESFMSFEVFHIRVSIHSNSLCSSTVGYGYLKCDDIQTCADCREKGGLEENPIQSSSNIVNPQQQIRVIVATHFFQIVQVFHIDAYFSSLEAELIPGHRNMNNAT